MELYMAPMEALTGYIYRNAFAGLYGGIDKYFTPFLASKKLNSKEKNEILPEHNTGKRVVPQILTNKAEEFLEIAKQLEDRGYESVNLNLGCPSGTVTAKNRGAGFLAVPDMLEAFLTEIFDKCPLKISVKTRVGVTETDDWELLVELFNAFPLEELIVHPRLQKDFYSGGVRLDMYERAYKMSRHRLCYNGDINSVEDYERIVRDFPETKAVMLGRGLLSDPSLALKIKGKNKKDRDTLRAFCDRLCRDYGEVMSGDRNTLFKLKELWVYFGKNFEDSEKLLKKIRKSSTVAEYKLAVTEIFLQD